MAEMKFKIGADISEFVTNTNKASTQLTQFSQKANQTGVQLQNNLKKGSNEAAFALGNLGRVAQDAPFGFTAISNNLNPLLESFQRLKVETGSTKGALSALGSSLMGAGGLGFALSAVSAAVVLAQVGFAAWTRGFGGAKDGVKQLDTELIALEQDIKSVNTSVDDLKGKLDFLLGLNKINIQLQYGDSFKGKELDMQGRSVTLMQEMVTLQEEKNKLKAIEDEAYQKFQKSLTREDNILLGGAATLKEISPFYDNLSDSAKKAFDVVKSANKEVLNVEKKMVDTQRESTLVQRGIILLRDEEKRRLDEIAAKKRKERQEELDRPLKELSKTLAVIEKQYQVGQLSFKEADVARVKAYAGAIEGLFQVGIRTKDKNVVNFIASIDQIESKQRIKEDLAKLAVAVNNEKIKPVAQIFEISTRTPSVRAKTPAEIAEEDAEKFKTAFEKKIAGMQKGLADIVNSTFNNTLSGIGEIIGETIAGGDVNKAFAGLFQIIASGMRQLGEAMIGLGTAKMALEKFGLAPGIGTVVAGIAVVALSSLLQSALPKFADGVTGFSGGFAMVGERGPEIVRLPQGSDVIPNHRLNGMGGAMVFIPDIRLKGSDLLVQFNRANQQKARRA